LVGLTAAALTGCGAHVAHVPALEMRFLETPMNALATERASEKLTMNVSLITDTKLRYLQPAELLKAAETTSGMDSQRLLKAGRTVIPGEGVVLLGTVRAQNARSSTTNLAVYTLALACAPAKLEQPGDLQNCQGYLLRVLRTGPGEVYGIDKATVSVIPEGGTAQGRLRAQTIPGGFKAEIQGDFAASILDVRADPGPGSRVER
jgi:hypothetical protein